MKILWFSNVVLSDVDKGVTGTWLGAIAERLIASGQVTLCNVARGNVRGPTPLDCSVLQQWLVPATPLNNDGFPSRKVVEGVLRIVDLFSPDLIHIWGVEVWWGLLRARGFLRQPVLLEIQGIKGALSRVFAGGLTLKEQRSCQGLKEMVMQRSIEKDRRKFMAWGRFEKEIIAGCHHVVTQTPWVESWVRAANFGCNTYQTELMLRKQFYEAALWTPTTNEPAIFCSAAYPAPYKGVHDAIRAIALLSRRFPKIRLRIAGAHQKAGLRQDGYVRWLNTLCDELGVSGRIDWLGALSAELIVQEIQNCSVFVMPSHCETYCVALAEALYLGCPSVTSFNGGTSWLVADDTTGVFYPPGDVAMCAYQVERLLTDLDLAIRLSQNARAGAVARNNPKNIIASQLEIYRQVIAKGSDC